MAPRGSDLRSKGLGSTCLGHPRGTTYEALRSAPIGPHRLWESPTAQGA